MKEKIKKLIIESLKKIDDVHDLDEDKIEVTNSKNKDLGDFSTNIALKLSKELGKNPIDIAKDILNNIKKDTYIKKIEIAKPGFINFFTTEDIKFEIINTIFSQKDKFGKNNIGNKEKVLMCKDCGYQSEDEKINEKYIIKDEISEEQRTKIEVIDEDLNSGGVPEEMIEELREQYREALENFEL